MGRHAIAEKLHRLLTKGVATEPEAVYLLVEVRKLLEITGQRAAYEGLLFHCEWALHSKMDRSTAKRFLKRFDDFHQIINKEVPDDPKIAQDIADLIGAQRFQHELSRFLESEHLPNGICAGKAWREFLGCYASIIEDCPLKIGGKLPSKPPGPPIHPKYVDEVVVQKVVGNDGDQNGALTIEWNIHFKQEPAHKAVNCFRIQIPPWAGEA